MLKLIVGFILVLGTGCEGDPEVKVRFVNGQCLAVAQVGGGVAMVQVPLSACVPATANCEAGTCEK